MAKYTPWFSIDVKPARKGLYEYEGTMLRREGLYWNGHDWVFPDDGSALLTWKSDKWRGLTRAAYLKAGGK